MRLGAAWTGLWAETLEGALGLHESRRASPGQSRAGGGLKHGEDVGVAQFEAPGVDGPTSRRLRALVRAEVEELVASLRTSQTSPTRREPAEAPGAPRGRRPPQPPQGNFPTRPTPTAAPPPLWKSAAEERSVVDSLVAVGHKALPPARQPAANVDGAAGASPVEPVGTGGAAPKARAGAAVLPAIVGRVQAQWCQPRSQRRCCRCHCWPRCYSAAARPLHDRVPFCAEASASVGRKEGCLTRAEIAAGRTWSSRGWRSGSPHPPSPSPHPTAQGARRQHRASCGGARVARRVRRGWQSGRSLVVCGGGPDDRRREGRTRKRGGQVLEVAGRMPSVWKPLWAFSRRRPRCALKNWPKQQPELRCACADHKGETGPPAAVVGNSAGWTRWSDKKTEAKHSGTKKESEGDSPWSVVMGPPRSAQGPTVRMMPRPRRPWDLTGGNADPGAEELAAMPAPAGAGPAFSERRNMGPHPGSPMLPPFYGATHNAAAGISGAVTATTLRNAARTTARRSRGPIREISDP